MGKKKDNTGKQQMASLGGMSSNVSHMNDFYQTRGGDEEPPRVMCFVRALWSPVWRVCVCVCMWACLLVRERGKEDEKNAPKVFSRLH